MSAPATPDLRDLQVIAPNLHHKYSGVTSTIVTLVPEQAKTLAIASVGPTLPPHVPRIPFMQLLTRGWSRPKGVSHRIWHARRNDEMIVGIILKHLLRQPWKLVFTSAAQRRHKPFTRWLMRRMDALIATSTGAASFLDQPATVIMHGIDTARFAPLPDRAAAWESTGLPGHYGIGAFGRLRYQKGTDLLIEALLRLLPKYPDFTAVLTGQVSAEEQGFVAALEKKIAAAGLTDRIRLLGLKPPHEIPFWFGVVSLYVAPMRWEGFGLTPLEAMASGTCVVSTRTGAAAQLVRDGETGTLIPPDDLEALIAAIEPLMADPAKAHAWGDAGRAHVLANHDMAGEVEAIRAVYQTLWDRA